MPNFQKVLRETILYLFMMNYVKVASAGSKHASQQEGFWFDPRAS